MSIIDKVRPSFLKRNSSAKEENGKTNTKTGFLKKDALPVEQNTRNKQVLEYSSGPEETSEVGILKDQETGTEVESENPSRAEETASLGQEVTYDQAFPGQDDYSHLHGRWRLFKQWVTGLMAACLCLEVDCVPPYQLDNRIFMQGQIEGVYCRFLFDSDSYYCTTGLNVIPKCRNTKLRISQTSLRCFPNASIVYMYQGVFNIQIGNHLLQEQLLLRDYAPDITLGTVFLKNFNIYLDYSIHAVKVEKRNVTFPNAPTCNSCIFPIDVVIDGKIKSFGLCTGSYITVVSQRILSLKLGAEMKPLKKNDLGCIGVVEVNLSIGGQSMDFPMFVADLEGDGILGADFFTVNHCKLYFENGVLQVYFKDFQESIRYEARSLPSHIHEARESE